MAGQSAPLGLTGGYNVSPMMRNREETESSKESDGEFSAATGTSLSAVLIVSLLIVALANFAIFP